jgi:hypothetical protein
VQAATQRCSVLQETSELLREQLASAQAEIAAGRGHTSELLAARQEVAELRERLRMLQIDSSRRVADADAAAADAGQQLMVSLCMLVLVQCARQCAPLPRNLLPVCCCPVCAT